MANVDIRLGHKNTAWFTNKLNFSIKGWTNGCM